MTIISNRLVSKLSSAKIHLDYDPKKPDCTNQGQTLPIGLISKNKEAFLSLAGIKSPS